LSEIEDMVQQAKAPGRFNIVDVLKGRGYPTSEIEVFIDENVAFVASDLEDEIRKLDEKMNSEKDKAALEELIAAQEKLVSEKDKLIEEMGGTRYVFHLQGISEGQRDDIWNKSIEKYPIKHDTDRNPLTGKVDRVEVQNPQRDKYFTGLLWQAHIKKIVDPSGDEQDGITVEEAFELRRSLPLASIGKITEAIEKMRASTAVFMMTVDEDFLAKS
jgi:hypothetical protein